MNVPDNLRIRNHEDVDLGLGVGVEGGEVGPGHVGHPVAQVLVVCHRARQDQETQLAVVDVHPSAHV